MKKTKITYGVHHLVEWHTILRRGKATVKVTFAGGSVTPQGVTPATYTTSDPVIQMVIEGSDEYKAGKIVRVRAAVTKEEIAVERNPADPSVTLPDAAPQEKCPGEVKNTPDPVDDADKQPTADTVAEDTPGDAGPTAGDTEATLSQITVANNDDARDYLEANFGLKRSKLHTRAEIVAAAAENGVSFIFPLR